ncbi:hypothetical protein RJ640_015620 [Escallonia rubra]|uniref:S-acyltransferase n=1 Tax=Escallonia rubra TaxID=112253 RepID=A0AA88RLR6_9ASTE|nr:hypothetical protein RJ640_015620 [Escallonia rubra]
MAEIENQGKQKLSWKVLGRCMVSLASVAFTQFSLYMVPYCFPSSSLLTLLPISAVAVLGVAGLGRCWKVLLGVRASAPAFVFFTLVFIWCVYIFVVRQAVSLFMDILFNAELLMLVIGLCSILSSDPGFVTHEPFCRDPADRPFSDVEAHSESSVLVGRVGYCKHCKAYVKGFDHHCPAFGNCIGQENHFLFMMLLAGFLISEASYIVCSFEFFSLAACSTALLYMIFVMQAKLSRNLAISTMLFSLLQVLWQVVFLIWHISCICINIKTDEWVSSYISCLYML